LKDEHLEVAQEMAYFPCELWWKSTFWQICLWSV